jgi:hypothetical protein
VLDDLVLEARVDPGLGQGRVGGFGLFQQVDADRVVAGAGGGDDDREKQAESVGDDAAFASDDLLAGVDALRGQGCVGRGLQASTCYDTASCSANQHPPLPLASPPRTPTPRLATTPSRCPAGSSRHSPLFASPHRPVRPVLLSAGEAVTCGCEVL